MVYDEYLRITQIRQQLPGKQFSTNISNVPSMHTTVGVRILVGGLLSA